jgi:hypothetical protein
MTPGDLLRKLAQGGADNVIVDDDWGAVHAAVAQWTASELQIAQPTTRSHAPGTLQITGTVQTALSGQLTWPAGGAVEISLAVIPANGAAPEQLQATIGLQAVATWKFSDSFTQLPASVDLRSLASPTQTPLADTLQIHDAWLLFNSHVLDDDLTLGGTAFGALHFDPGLACVMRLQPLALLKPLASTTAEVTLTGQMVPQGNEKNTTLGTSRFAWDVPGLPGIHLQAAVLPELAISAKLKLALTWRLYCPLSDGWLKNNPACDPVMGLTGDVDLASAQVKAHFTAERVLSAIERVELLAEFTDAQHQSINVDDLVAIFSDGPPSNFLQQNLPDAIHKALDAISLKGVAVELVGLDDGTYHVASTGIYLGLHTGPLQLIEHVVEVTADAVQIIEIVLHDPFGGSPLPLLERVSGTLVLDVELFDAPVLAMISVPHFSFDLRLNADQAIPIASVLTHPSIGLKAEAAPVPFVVEDFEVAADMDGTFSVAAAIAAAPPWTIALGNTTSLALESVNFKAARYAWGDKEASFGATLRLGNPDQDPFEVEISAAVRTGTDAGWHFQGNLKLDEEIPVGRFIERLVYHFGQSQTPDSLEALTIDEFLLAFDVGSGQNQGNKDFNVALAVKFPIAGQMRQLRLGVEVRSSTRADQFEFHFDVTLGRLQFDIDYTASNALPPSNGDSSGTAPAKSTRLLATLRAATGGTLNIQDFYDAVGVGPPDLPEALREIDLESAQLELDTDPNGRGLLLSAVSRQYGQLVIALVKVAPGVGSGSWKPFFAIAFKPVISFERLPVIGSHVKDFDIEQIQIAGLPEALSAADLVELKKIFSSAVPPVPLSLIPTVAAGQGLPAEAVFNAVLKMGSQRQPVNLVLKSSAPASASAPALTGPPAAGPTPAPGGGADIAQIPANNTRQGVDKTFGPVHVRQFNLAYSAGKVTLDVSGELTLAGIGMSFQGMSVGMKFPPKDISDLSFRLHGLGVSVSKADLRIAGGFITLDEQFDNFMGMLSINAGSIGMQAFGGYATTTPTPSFFIFVHVNVPLGGPPFFFLDGLAGGLGINRRFKLPGFDELANFPLLPNSANNPIPSGPPGGIDDVTQAVTKLAKFIPPQAGAYWIAAGLDFMSFEIIQVDAILEVTFGSSLQIGLLANAAMSIPEPEEPIAYIDIALEVDFDPDEGVLAVFGMLTPASFVFGGACHLSGGFAFFTWFKGEHEGDFLVTIGGYHPAFARPAWYPAVPRLAMNWDLDVLKISGSSYFALTPHMLMAGLEFKALFDISVVKATFDAGFDFLLGWKPFFYTADAYIHISVELHLGFTIAFHVAVDLDLWGPEFGGKAHVDLTIFSFTIPFGSDAPTPPPIPWSEFKKLLPNSLQASVTEGGGSAGSAAVRMLASDSTAPPGFAISQVTLASGLLQELTRAPLPEADLQDERFFNWLVDPNAFEILVTAGAPSNDFRLNAEAAPRSVEKYCKPEHLDRYYANPDRVAGETLFVYDCPEDVAATWWQQPVQVGPVGIPPGAFNEAGARLSGFGSTLNVEVVRLGFDGNGKPVQSPESNFVVTLVSKNAAAALWGPTVTAKNGDGQLNDAPTLPNTLFGITLTPKRWNPLQTRQINLYELLYEDSNDLSFPPVDAPAVPANTFNTRFSSDGDGMTFDIAAGRPVLNQERELQTGAFANLGVGKAQIDQINALFGFNLTVGTDAARVAGASYKDWPVLALLGEEDAQASNQP